MINAVTTHVKENKVPYLVALLVPFIPIMVGVVNTRAYTDYTMEVHALKEGIRITGLTESVDQILELQLAREIRDLMVQRCKYPSQTLNTQLDRLQREYRKVTDPSKDYPQIDCRQAV